MLEIALYCYIQFDLEVNCVYNIIKTRNVTKNYEHKI